MYKKLVILCLFLCVGLGISPYIYEKLKWMSIDKKINKAFSITSNIKANIAFVTWELSRTGEPIMLMRLAKMLQQDGYNVAVFYKEKPSLVSELEASGIPVINAPITKRNYTEYMHVLQRNFDLAIVCEDNMPTEYAMISAVLPTIWWLHETATKLKNMPLLHYERSSTKMLHYQAFVDLLKTYYLADIVTVSAFARDSMVGHVRDDVTVIINAVDQKEIDNSKIKGNSSLYKTLLERHKQKTVFLQVGKIFSLKGQDVLLEAVAQLPESYQKKSLFYIIGGEEAYDEYGKKLRKKYSYLTNVIWTGEITRLELDDYYRTADVLLHPSTEDDAAPCVIMEAAMYYIPAVRTYCVGADYITQNNESGFVIPQQNAQALKEKIMWFIDHPQQTKAMGKKAYQKFLRTSTPERFLEQWEEKINSLLISNKP